MYVPVFDQECEKCSASPCVGLLEGGGVRTTSLCGVCFFSSRLMVDWDFWNDVPDATE